MLPHPTVTIGQSQPGLGCFLHTWNSPELIKGMERCLHSLSSLSWPLGSPLFLVRPRGFKVQISCWVDPCSVAVAGTQESEAKVDLCSGKSEVPSMEPPEPK